MAEYQLTQLDENYLNYCEQMYTLYGDLPSKEKSESNGFDSLYYGRLTGDNNIGRAYRAQLVAREIPTGVLDELIGVRKRSEVLTELQYTTAVVMLDLRDTRPQIKKLTELGVSTTKYNAWLRDPTYQNFVRTLAEKMLEGNQHEAHYALLGKVRAGDMGAIQYYNKLTGRFNDSPAATGSLDTRALLTRIIEAIQKHVRDPEVQQAIADEILSYTQANGIASAVLDAPYRIPIPTSYETTRLPTTPVGDLPLNEVM